MPDFHECDRLKTKDIKKFKFLCMNRFQQYHKTKSKRLRICAKCCTPSEVAVKNFFWLLSLSFNKGYYHPRWGVDFQSPMGDDKLLQWLRLYGCYHSPVRHVCRCFHILCRCTSQKFIAFLRHFIFKYILHRKVQTRSLGDCGHVQLAWHPASNITIFSTYLTSYPPKI